MNKRTDRIRSLFVQPAPEVLSADNGQAEPLRVTAGAVNAIRGTFSEIERENEALRSEMAASERIVELDPALIDPSPFADRFPSDDEPSFRALLDSIRERGQEVPTLVRPHPAHPGRYQTAYGHRRIRAARELGRKVRALIRPLQDDELVLAQGVENAAREDLSFIERAFFALRLEEAGRSRSVIQQALAIDKAEASKLMAVARAVPWRVARAIGRAPKAGRFRWQELAERLANSESAARVQALVEPPEFARIDSDARFAAALETARHSPVVAATKVPFRMDIKGPEGQVLARIKETDRQLNLVVDRGANIAFADYLVRELPDLYARFLDADEQSPTRRRGN
ncbi:MAG: plasmid partitioning protein RepB [Beijerinckiaceae bacterium]